MSLPSEMPGLSLPVTPATAPTASAPVDRVVSAGTDAARAAASGVFRATRLQPVAPPAVPTECAPMTVRDERRMAAIPMLLWAREHRTLMPLGAAASQCEAYAAQLTSDSATFAQRLTALVGLLGSALLMVVAALATPATAPVLGLLDELRSDDARTAEAETVARLRQELHALRVRNAGCPPNRR